MTNTPQQTTGIAQEYSYAYQGAGGQWVMTKEEFEGHKGFPVVRNGSIGTFWEIPLLIDETTRYTLSEWSLGAGGNMYSWLGWTGAAVAQDGNIYAQPAIQYNEGLILETEGNKLIPFDNQGSPQVGVVSHPNGKLYTIPGDGNILEIDPINKTSHQVYVSGSTSTNVFAGGSGGYTLSAKYTFCAGVVAPNNQCIYYIPDSADQVVKLDPATRSVSLIGTQSGAIGYNPTDTTYNSWNNSGRGKFCTGVLGPDGMIYMIGGYHRAIGKIDPYTDTVTWTHKAIVNTETLPNAGADPDHWYRIDSYQVWGGYATGGNEYVAPMIMPTQSACLAPDGWIYILPNQYPWIMKYNPLLNIFRMHVGDVDWSTLNLNALKELAVGPWDTSDNELLGRHKHRGAFVAADGNVYAGPAKHWVKRGGGSTPIGEENTPTNNTGDNYNYSILKVITGVNAIPKDFTDDEKAQGFSTPAIKPQGNMAMNYSNLDNCYNTCILGPNGHMYCIPGKNKNGTTTLTDDQDGVTWDLPQGALEIHLGIVAKPAEELYGPYISTQQTLI